MKKFRYYVTDLFDGCIRGTNNLQTALDFAASEDHLVVDSETNEWMHTTGREQVQEIDEVIG